jgi:hypothetical protein
LITEDRRHFVHTVISTALLVVWGMLSGLLATHWVADIHVPEQDIRTSEKDFFRLAMAVVPFVLLGIGTEVSLPFIEGERHRAVETGFLMSRSLLGDPPQSIPCLKYVRKGMRYVWCFLCGQPVKVPLILISGFSCVAW